jgi:general secretion pathway protein A
VTPPAPTALVVAENESETALPSPPDSAPPAAVAAAPPADAPQAIAPGVGPAGGQGQETVSSLLVRALRLWGVNDRLSESDVRSWPVGPDGSPQIETVAERYQLTATFLPNTTLSELRSIGLPALVELREPPGKRVYLLRRIESSALVFLTASGDELQLPVESFESAWSHAAWVLWRNIDLLPADPNQAMTPTVIATLALRLQKLGYLQPPLPAAYGERFEQAVRRFQRATGLPEDGIVGPRTTLALARVVGGRFSPTIVDLVPR